MNNKGKCVKKSELLPVELDVVSLRDVLAIRRTAADVLESTINQETATRRSVILDQENSFHSLIDDDDTASVVTTTTTTTTTTNHHSSTVTTNLPHRVHTSTVDVLHPTARCNVVTSTGTQTHSPTTRCHSCSHCHCTRCTRSINDPMAYVATLAHRLEPLPSCHRSTDARNVSTIHDATVSSPQDAPNDDVDDDDNANATVATVTVATVDASSSTRD